MSLPLLSAYANLYKSSVPFRTADVLLKFRDIMWSTVQYTLEREYEYENYGSKVMSEYKNQLLETLAKALDASSEHTYGHNI